MNNTTIEPRLIALLNSDEPVSQNTSPSLELPPLHDPNILKASGRPLLLEPDASHSHGSEAQSAGPQLGPKHSSVILPVDDDVKTQNGIEAAHVPGNNKRGRALGISSPQSLRKILDDREGSGTGSANKRTIDGVKDDFVKLPQPALKKQKTTQQVVPPIIVGLYQVPEPQGDGLFPPIASSSFHDSHGRNTLNTIPLKVKVKAPKDSPRPDNFSAAEKNAEESKAKPKRNARRTRNKWTEEETNNLLLGAAKHGVGSWKDILDDKSFLFNDRSAADLKDRFRTCCPDELREKNFKMHSPLGVDSGNKYVSKPKSKSSLMSENILLEVESFEQMPKEMNPSQQPRARSHRKKVEDLAELGIQGPFQKSGRRQRTPFTEKEDRAILQGFHAYGPAWTKIQRDPRLNLQNRSPTDIRDRYRNKFRGKFKNDDNMLADSSSTMPMLTQEWESKTTDTPTKDNSTLTHDPTSLQTFSSRDGLRTQEMISMGQDMMKAPTLQHQNSYVFKDNYTFTDHLNMDSADNPPYSQAFDWNSNLPAPFGNIGEMDISRLLLSETEQWPDIPTSNTTDAPTSSGKEKQSFTDINSIITTNSEPSHNEPSFFNMLNDPIPMDEMNDGFA